MVILRVVVPGLPFSSLLTEVVVNLCWGKIYVQIICGISRLGTGLFGSLSYLALAECLISSNVQTFVRLVNLIEILYSIIV